MSNIQLFNYFRSSTSYRVRIALHYKKLPFTYIPIHLLKAGGEQYSETYRNINPLMEVPSININGKNIAQSLVILELLEELFPENPLYPKDIFEKSKVKQFCENINSFMHPLNNLKVLQYLEKTYEVTDEEKQSWIHHWLKIGFDSLEQLIQTNHGTYCFGNNITAADVCLIPQVFTAQRFNFNIDPYSRVSEINNICKKIESFGLAHPFRQIDTPEDLKIR